MPGEDQSIFQNSALPFWVSGRLDGLLVITGNREYSRGTGKYNRLVITGNRPTSFMWGRSPHEPRPSHSVITWPKTGQNEKFRQIFDGDIMICGSSCVHKCPGNMKQAMQKIEDVFQSGKHTAKSDDFQRKSLECECKNNCRLPFYRMERGNEKLI